MNNIIKHYGNIASQRLAKEINDYFLQIYKIPNWILKRRWLMKLYCKFYKIRIENQRNLIDLSNDYRFFRLNKKVGELKIRDMDLIDYKYK